MYIQKYDYLQFPPHREAQLGPVTLDHQFIKYLLAVINVSSLQQDKSNSMTT